MKMRKWQNMWCILMFWNWESILVNPNLKFAVNCPHLSCFSLNFQSTPKTILPFQARMWSMARYGATLSMAHLVCTWLPCNSPGFGGLTAIAGGCYESHEESGEGMVFRGVGWWVDWCPLRVTSMGNFLKAKYGKVVNFIKFPWLNV